MIPYEPWGKEGLQDPPPRGRREGIPAKGSIEGPPRFRSFSTRTTDAFQQGFIEGQGERLGIASGKLQRLASGGQP